MIKLSELKETLNSGGYTLAVSKDETLLTSREKGIRPLLELALSKDDLSGAYAADRIVGKAAAMLYTIIKAKAVYAEVLSEKAAEVFEKYGIAYEYDTLTENIINRMGTGLCPMEDAVKDISQPEQALRAIDNKVKTLKK